MLPGEKALVERMKSRPFALLGINSDPREKVKEILEREGITWRQAIEGSTHGPLATKWNVRGWPTIYVIDAKGVIRARDLRGDMLDQMVEKLVGEVEAGRGGAKKFH